MWGIPKRHNVLFLVHWDNTCDNCLPIINWLLNSIFNVLWGCELQCGGILWVWVSNVSFNIKQPCSKKLPESNVNVGSISTQTYNYIRLFSIHSCVKGLQMWLSETSTHVLLPLSFPRHAHPDSPQHTIWQTISKCLAPYHVKEFSLLVYYVVTIQFALWGGHFKALSSTLWILSL